MNNQLIKTDMKKFFLLMLLTVSTVAAFTQNDDQENSSRKSDDIQTLMGKNNTVGGYGAISVAYTQIENRDAFVFGAKGGILMGHIFTMGLGGSGFFNDVHTDLATGKDLSLAGGYGGVYFEPILLPRFPVHVSFPILIGAGGVAIVSVSDDGQDWSDNYKSEASDAFMVIEPGMEVELNITRYFRFCLGAYYRYTSNVDIEDPELTVPTDILNGFTGGVTFKFGRF
jgi:hypothetical protein